MFANGTIQVPEQLFKTGRNKVSPEILSVLSDFDKLAKGLKFDITDALRDETHGLTAKNPGSMHTVGDAIDLDITAGAGISQGKLDKFWELHQAYQKKNPNVEVFIELDKNSPDYVKYVKKYGTAFIKPFYGHTTGVHSHIEYNRKSNR